MISQKKEKKVFNLSLNLPLSKPGKTYHFEIDDMRSFMFNSPYFDEETNMWALLIRPQLQSLFSSNKLEQYLTAIKKLRILSAFFML